VLFGKFIVEKEKKGGGGDCFSALHEGRWGSGGTVSIITYLGTRWRYVENCTHHCFPPGKRTPFVLLE